MSCGRTEMAEDFEPIGVGTRGTIGSLMCRELESMRRTEHLQKTARRMPRSDAVSIPCGRPLPSLSGYRFTVAARKSHDSGARKSSCEAPPTPRASNADRCDLRKGSAKDPQRAQQKSLPNFGKAAPRKSSSLDGPSAVDVFCANGDLARGLGAEFRTPMLAFQADGGPRKSAEKRGVGVAAGMCSLVEVVDLKCNAGDKIWGSPIANRLRRLSFSRLSDAL